MSVDEMTCTYSGASGTYFLILAIEDLLELLDDVREMLDEQPRRTILSEVHERCTAVRLRARIVVIVEDGEQTGNDFVVELLLKRSLKIGRHLTQRIASSVSNARMLNERREGPDNAEKSDQALPNL